MKFWLKFFADKRFSWDFKIANFIMGDSLRNYLAVDSMILERVVESNQCNNFYMRQISKVVDSFEKLMCKTGKCK